MGNNNSYNIIHSLCVKCKNNIPFLTLDEEGLKLDCKCGFNSTMAVKEFIMWYNSSNKTCSYKIKCNCSKGLRLKFYSKSQKKYYCNKCNPHFGIEKVFEIKNLPVEEIRKKLQQGEEHLNNYFKYLKESSIQKYPNQETEIEAAYKKCIDYNTDLLSFANIIIDNYKEDNYIQYENVRKNCFINIYKYIEYDEHNANGVIDFFNQYNFINLSSKIKCKYKGQFKFGNMIHLKDGLIAATYSDKAVIILKLNKNEFSFVEYKGGIKSIFKLDNEKIASETTTTHGSITIWSIKTENFSHPLFTIKNPHENYSNFTIVNLSNNLFASAAQDGLIKIWSCDEPYSNTPVKILKGHSSQIVAMVFLKNKNTLISRERTGLIIKWNLFTSQTVSLIKLSCSFWANSLYQVDDDRIAIGSYGAVTLLNVSTMIVEDKISESLLGEVNCFLKLRDNMTLLAGALEGKILLYNLKTKEHNVNYSEVFDTEMETLIEKQKGNSIISMAYIDEHTFITCARDIKVWNY